jgi:phosphate transport system substrate-binding protein
VFGTNRSGHHHLIDEKELTLLMSPLQRARRFLMGGMVAALMLVACTPAAPPPTAEPKALVVLTASGSGSVSSILTAIKPAFEADAPGYTLNVLSGTGTGGGVTGVLEKALDIAAMARPAKTEETDKGLKYTQFGRAGITFIIHADVTAKDLTLEQARDIFYGKITNWSAVGGQDLPIVVYVRDEDDTSTTLLREKAFGEDPFPATIAGTLTSTGDMLTAIEGTPGGIGFASWPSILASKKNVKTLTLKGVQPNKAEYDVLATLGIGYLDAEKVKPLIEWLASEKGRTVLAGLGVITA